MFLLKWLMPTLFLCADEGAGANGGGAGGSGGQVKTFTQEELDGIIESRLKREREKYQDYEDLKKFRTEHEKAQEAKTQKELEEQKKYEELKKNWESEKGNYSKALSEKDQAINNLKIEHELSLQIIKHNAYEDAIPIIKNSVVVGEDGMPKMKGKDTVGNEVLISLDEGVKKFLTERPYLVKATQNKGGGTPPTGGGAGGDGVVELDTLNAELFKAQQSGDTKKVQELKAKINAYFTDKGIRRFV